MTKSVHTYKYIHIYIFAWVRTWYAGVSQIKSLGIHWNTSMTKERLDISLFRLTNGVSLGHTCCSFFHVGKVSMSPSYGSIGIGMSRIVSTWNVHHWLHYCFHISQQFIVSKETGTTESLPLSHISVIPEAAIGVKGEVVGEKCQKDGIRGQQWRDHTYAKIIEVQHEFGREKSQ